MKVGFFSLSPASGNISVELVLAALLHHGRDQAIFVHCDSAQPRCGIGISQSEGRDPQYCQACHIGIRDLRQSALQGRVPTLALSALIDGDRLQALHAAIDATADRHLLTMRFNGWDIGRWMIAGLRNEYFGERWQELPDWPHKAREWLKTVGSVALATETFLRQQRPDCVVVFNGLTPAERAVREVCLLLGVRCLTYEQGQLARTLLLREDSPACLYDVAPEWRQWADVPLSIAESRHLDAYLFHRQHGATVADYVFSPAVTGDLDALRRRLNLAADRPVLVAFTNVTADSSVFEAQQAFDSQSSWLETCCRYAGAHPELDLVIRVHPAERSVQTRRYGELITTRDPIVGMLQALQPGLPPNVRLVGPDDPVSSYDLMHLATVCLVYVSTVGMEAASLGKPVVSAGRCHFSDKGFTWHVSKAAAFASTLDRLLESPQLPPQARERVRRYMYLFYFRTCYRLPVLEALQRLDDPPIDPEAFYQGYARLLTDTAAYETAQDHVRRFILGQVPYAPGPAVWRPRDTGPVPEALPVPERPLIVLWPRWHALAADLAALDQAVEAAGVSVSVTVLAPSSGPSAMAELESALTALGEERWRLSVDLRPGGLPAAELGRLLAQASGLVVPPDVTDPRLVGMADDLQVPCLEVGTADLMTFLRSLG